MTFPPFGQQVEGASLGQNALTVEARAVVGKLNQDISRFVKRGKSERAARRFAERVTHTGRLDAMIDSIPDHVKEWILEVLENASIDLNLPTDNLESRKFVVALGNVADGAGELLKQRTHRYKAHAHNLFLQVLLQALDLAMYLENSAPSIGF